MPWKIITLTYAKTDTVGENIVSDESNPAQINVLQGYLGAVTVAQDFQKLGKIQKEKIKQHRDIITLYFPPE